MRESYSTKRGGLRESCNTRKWLEKRGREGIKREICTVRRGERERIEGELQYEEGRGSYSTKRGEGIERELQYEERRIEGELQYEEMA